MRNPLQYIGKVFGFITEYATDMWLFMRHNSHSPLEDKNRKDFFQTIILTHTIEKGLSLEHPRPMFGRAKIAALLGQLRSYSTTNSMFPLGMANGALAAYRDFNVRNGEKDDPTLEEIGKHLETQKAQLAGRTGGVKYTSTSPSALHGGAVEFLRSRASCRMFTSEALPRDLIADVLILAQTAPSQCNRQSSRAHFYQDRDQIEQLLNIQKGAAGFSENVGNLFIITSEITAWGGPQQRNQLYIDGGLYSMQLILACHAHGIVSCPLNLAVTNAKEREIKKVGAIKPGERLIMMLAVGKAAVATFKAASSPRLSVDESACFH